MGKVDDFLTTIGFKKRNISSPVPQVDVLDTPGKRAYVAENSNREFAATMANGTSPVKNVNTVQPITIKKSTPVMANNTSPIVEKKDMAGEFIKRVRKEHPENKLSDDRLRSLYKDFGDKILGNPPKKQVLASGTVNIDPNFERILNDVIFPITRKEGIPDALAAAQTAIESGRKITPNNNLHGIMQWDSQGNRSLRSFKDPYESAQNYVSTIKNNFPEAYAQRKDPQKMLRALQSGAKRYEGDNKDPMHYVSLVESTPEWKKYLASGGQ